MTVGRKPQTLQKSILAMEIWMVVPPKPGAFPTVQVEGMNTTCQEGFEKATHDFVAMLESRLTGAGEATAAG